MPVMKILLKEKCFIELVNCALLFCQSELVEDGAVIKAL